MPPLKLRTQLALWYAFLTAILLAFSSVAVFEVIELRLTTEADDNLVDHMAGLWGYVRFNNGVPSIVYDSRNEYQTYFLREATRYYQIYDAETAKLLIESEDSALMGLSLSPEQVHKLVAHPGIDVLAHMPVPLRFRTAVFRENEHPYLVRVGVSVEQDLATLSEVRRDLLWVVPLMIAIAVVGSWLLAGHALRPLRDLEQEAAEVTINRLDRRLSKRGTGDELDSLAGTFNEVLMRLERSVKQMRDFADFFAHELRTPMTILRGEAEVTLMRSDLPKEWRLHLESELEEFRKLHRLIDRSLLIAKAETIGIQLDAQRISLSGLALNIAEAMRPVAENVGVQLSTACDKNVEVYADREWLERAILNLIDNALKFTPAGGNVRLAVHHGSSGAVIEVADSGCGIGSADLPYIFDRFYRANGPGANSKSPGGIGLTLTKCVVEQHHGTISVHSVVDEGSTFTVVLPMIEEDAI